MKLNFDVSEKSNWLCSDHYIITTLVNFDIHTVFLPGTSSITYKLVNDTEVAMVKKQGLKLIRLCDEWVKLIPDLLKTITLFGSNLVPLLPKNVVTNFLVDAIEKFEVNYTKEWVSEFLPET